MDIFKSPWKSSLIDDPIISLSNSQRHDKRDNYSDRYCTQSLAKDLFYVQNDIQIQSSECPSTSTPSSDSNKYLNYHGLLVRTCSSQSDKKPNNKHQSILQYKTKISRPGYNLNLNLNSHSHLNLNLNLNQQFPQQQILSSIPAKPRSIPKQPYRILNAPRLKDDFYTNLLDWSPQDLVSVVLDNSAYIWNSKQNQTQKLVQGFISSIKWCNKGLLIGEETGKLRLIDHIKQKQTLKIRNHNGRIGTLDSIDNLVISGSKDSHILIYDIRSRQIVHKYQSHKQQVCGVKFSFDGNMIASGGNDNIVSIWDIKACKNVYKFNQHTAAVKALAWSPHQSYILSTGGGSTDKSIRSWNINQGRCIKKIDTGSQVCNMMYSINSNELVSTHGFSMNAINIWNGKNMDKIGTLRGHSYRVLYLARSPDGESILTGSGDQTLRFWKLFPNSGSIYNRVSCLEAKNTYLR